MKLRLLARMAALVALAGAASAPASSAPFTGSLTFYLFPGLQQDLPAVIFGGGSGVSNASLVTLPGDAFVGTATATTPISAAPPISGNQVVVTGHDPGTFTGGPLAGTMRLGGWISIFALGGYPALELFRVPLSIVGAPGATNVSVSGGISVTSIGAGWSAGNVAVTLPTPSGGVRTTSFAGYDHRVGGVGSLQLVTPILVRTNVTDDILYWSALTLTFVPEPTTALLLGMGAVGLGFVGRARSRSRR